MTAPSPMNWWVSAGNGEPIGPVSTELLIRGIIAGKVPGDALVCAVGRTTWSPISSIDHFANAFAHLSGGDASHFDDPSEQTLVDLVSSIRSALGNQAFDDPDEKTIVDTAPNDSSVPPPNHKA